jgi:hypothetical protein
VLDIDVLNPVSDAQLNTPISDVFLDSVWSQLCDRIISVTVALSRKSSAAKAVRSLFAGFKGRVFDFNELAINCFAKVCPDETNKLFDHRLLRVMDNLLYALNGISEDEKVASLYARFEISFRKSAAESTSSCSKFPNRSPSN